MRMSALVPEDFGKRLSTVLVWLDIPQHDLALRLGISSSFLSRLRSGDKRPSKPVAKLMERELGEKAWAFCMGKSELLPTVSAQ